MAEKATWLPAWADAALEFAREPRTEMRNTVRCVRIVRRPVERGRNGRNGRRFAPPFLTAGKSSSLEVDDHALADRFEMIVQGKAQASETIVAAGQGLRFGAEALLSPSLDTPAKLDAAVAALRTQALGLAQQLGVPT